MRQFNVGMSFLLAILLLSGCFSIPTGDGGSIKLTKDGVKMKTAEGEEAVISASGKDGGTVSIKGRDADGKEADIKLSVGSEIPKDFPSAIPIPKGAKVIGTQNLTSGDKKNVTVMYEIEGSVKDVAKLYKDYMKKEKYTGITEFANSDMEMHSGELNGYGFVAVITIDQGKKLAVVLTYTSK